MKLSGVQKFIRLLTSKEKFLAMEEESKEWKYICSDCKVESNVWESGGIRFKAKGEPTVKIKCPNCGHIGKQKLKHLK